MANYAVSKDVANELQKKYGSTLNVEHFVQDLFTSLINKALKDGSSVINGLGSFLSYVTYSGRHGKNVVRFKFKISPYFRKKVIDDSYLLNSLPIKAQVPFTEVHESKCNPDLRDQNVKLSIKSLQYAKEKEKEYEHSQLVLDLISDLKNKDEDDDE